MPNDLSPRAYLRRVPCLWLSVFLHILIIALASLISFSIPMTSADDIGVVCELRGFRGPDELRAKSINDIDCTISNGDTPPVDSTIHGCPEFVNSDIVVSPEIRATQDLGNHFESIDPEKTNWKDGVGDPELRAKFKTKDDNNVFGDGGLHGTDLSDDVLGAGLKFPGRNRGQGGGEGNSVDWGTANLKIGSQFARRMGATSRATACTAGEKVREPEDGCINTGLRWLARNQEADGHWDAMKLGAQHKTDTAVTALALLAFTGAGHRERGGQYRDSVKLAIAWLIAHQQSNGLIFDSTDAGSYRGGGYPHAIATLALSEAAGISRLPTTRAAAQRAVDYLTQWREQNEKEGKLGWRYAPGQSGDLSVTGWCVMALKSAKIAGLHVDSDLFEHALKFVESVEIKDADGGTSHFGYRPGEDHAETAHLLTAIGATVRQLCGQPRDATQESVEWFIEKGGLPAWGARGESVDLYYWYFGTVSTFNQRYDIFKRWHEALWRTLAEHQCKDGDDAGSWPIVGEYSDEWGRAGQTAMSVLCLDTYYGFRSQKLKD